VVDIIVIYLAAGLFSGFVSGLFGVGGAFALAPALIITLTLQGVGDTHLMHLTIATSLATQLVTAILTSVLRYRAGDLRMPMLFRIAPFVGLGAIIGAAIGDILPSDVLKIFFMCFIGFSILRTLMQRPATVTGEGAQVSDLRGGAFWFLSIISGISGGLLGPGHCSGTPAAQDRFRHADRFSRIRSTCRAGWCNGGRRLHRRWI
jgi:uncharacterized membrane protein YfcA